IPQDAVAIRTRTPAMCTNLRLWTIVVWIGVLANWSFAVWAIFFNTASLLDTFKLGPVESTVWIYNYSVLLAILSCFYIPAAHDPFRYRANAWLLIIGRMILAALVLLAVLGAAGWYKLFRGVPVHYASDVDHFKYGSVGVEAANGLPYWVWAVLPEVFADKMPGPGGYAAFGFLSEKGHDAPIGLPVETVGFPRVGLNCGLCHIGSVRASATAP